MKITAVLFSVGMIAAASAQSSSASSQKKSPIDNCDPADVSCQAKELNLPYPNMTDVNKTTKCSADCPQGDGTAEATQKYADCLEKCRKENYMPGGVSPSYGSIENNDSTAVTVPTATSTSTSAQATATVTSASGTKTYGSSNSTASKTASSDDSNPSATSTATETASTTTATSTPTASSGAAGKLVASGAGFVAVFAAFFAL
jgi:cobalamin biosynthesis Mg chelatase CobN